MYSTGMLRTLPLLASILAPCVLAQTWTSCNPLNTTNCPNDQALGVANYSINFMAETMTSTVWNTTAGVINYGADGAEFTIAQRGDSPTVQSNFYLFFGQVEVIMKAASGQGIISSIVLESNVLDEVDWEFMGGNTTHVETNFFSKGNQTVFTNSKYYPVADPQDNYHNYTLDWSSEKLEWIIDGNVVRTLRYADCDGGKSFPQTPMDVRLGIWAGGDSKEPNGTIQWAGGLTDYDKLPFTMAVKSLRVSDASRGTEYRYGDETGSWQSIQVLNSTKPLSLDGNNSASTSQTMKQKWNSLSKTAKIAIAASVGGVLVLALAVLAFCCIKQRRAGRRERALEDAKFEKNTADVLAYRAEMARWQQEKGPRQQQQQLPLLSQQQQQQQTGPRVMGGNAGNAGSGRNSWGFGPQRGYQRF